MVLMKNRQNWRSIKSILKKLLRSDIRTKSTKGRRHLHNIRITGTINCLLKKSLRTSVYIAENLMHWKTLVAFMLNITSLEINLRI